MTHRGYSAFDIDIDDEAGTISGRIAVARGGGTFEGDSIAGAIRAFRDSVDDYLAMCAEDGVQPEAPGLPPSAVRAERGTEPEPPAPSAVPALAMG